jgi:hypothetical protein
MIESAVRDQVQRLLEWEGAHASFDKAIDGIPPASRGQKPTGLPYSPWQLLEHLRRAQSDILDFCVNPHYKELEFPHDYWPTSAAPASDRDWDESVRRFRDDRRALQALAANPSLDLTSQIPHGQGQTYLREIVLAADHTAYHVGELIVVRRLLGIWPS